MSFEFKSQPPTLLSALVLIFLISMTHNAGAGAGASEVLGFKAWKLQQIEEAKLALERVQNSQKTVGSSASSSASVVSASAGVGSADKAGRTKKESKGGESRLEQAQLNFDIASELSVSDYFVLYINQLSTPTAIREAAEKMSSEEVAELMWAYKKQLESGRGSFGYIPPVEESLRLGSGVQPRTVGL